jgi:hypothetical protein
VIVVTTMGTRVRFALDEMWELGASRDAETWLDAWQDSLRFETVAEQQELVRELETDVAHMRANAERREQCWAALAQAEREGFSGVAAYEQAAAILLRGEVI